jgi:hypothetical protein
MWKDSKAGNQYFKINGNATKKMHCLDIIPWLFFSSVVDELSPKRQGPKKA